MLMQTNQEWHFHYLLTSLNMTIIYQDWSSKKKRKTTNHWVDSSLDILVLHLMKWT